MICTSFLSSKWHLYDHLIKEESVKVTSWIHSEHSHSKNRATNIASHNIYTCQTESNFHIFNVHVYGMKMDNTNIEYLFLYLLLSNLSSIHTESFHHHPDTSSKTCCIKTQCISVSLIIDFKKVNRPSQIYLFCYKLCYFISNLIQLQETMTYILAYLVTYKSCGCEKQVSSIETR